MEESIHRRGLRHEKDSGRGEMVLPQFIVQYKRQERAVLLDFKGGVENKRSFFSFF